MQDTKDIQTQMLLRQIHESEQQFAELDKLNVRSVPENIFVHHFLSFFSGEVKENKQELLSNWLTIAGGAVNPVNIVSNGRIVAQVPPIQNNEALDPSTKTQDTGIGYALKESNAMASLSPTAGNAILSGHLGNKLNAMTSHLEDSNKAHEKKWDDLLKHYGKKPLNYKEDSSKTDDEGDVFGFE